MVVQAEVVVGVPKSTAPFGRLVTDARPVHVFADKWNVKYISIKSLRLILGPIMLFSIVDLKFAYHLCVLGRCRRPWNQIFRWLLSVDEKTYRKIATYVIGRVGYSCSSFCDKAMPVCIGSHIMRFAATPIGHATSHGSLALLAEAIIRNICRILGLDGGGYVDDLIMAYRVVRSRPSRA